MGHPLKNIVEMSGGKIWHYYMVFFFVRCITPLDLLLLELGWIYICSSLIDETCSWIGHENQRTLMMKGSIDLNQAAPSFDSAASRYQFEFQ